MERNLFIETFIIMIIIFNETCEKFKKFLEWFIQSAVNKSLGNFCDGRLEQKMTQKATPFCNFAQCNLANVELCTEFLFETIAEHT